MTNGKPSSRRNVFRGLQYARVSSSEIRYRIIIARRGEDFIGEAVGRPVPGRQAELAARASLEAVGKATGTGEALVLDGVRVVDLFDRRLVVVGVRGLVNRSEAPLVGSCYVRTSTEEAAALAALRASERWAEYEGYVRSEGENGGGPG